PFYDQLSGDISPGLLRYENIVGSSADDSARFDRFMETIFSAIGKDSQAADIPVYTADFSMHFDTVRHTSRGWPPIGPKRPYGHATICESTISHHQCRSRSYSFFGRHSPEDMAQTILNDIVHSVPTISSCDEVRRL